MKKFILSLFLLLMCVSIDAQQYYKNVPYGEYEVTESCDKSKDQIFKLIREWLSINFKPTEYTLQINEADSRYIINWEIPGEPYSKYTKCNVSCVYLIDVTDGNYTLKVRKPQCILQPTGFPHQYVLPYRSSVAKAVKSFVEETSEKYYNKSLSWDDDKHMADIANELYEESLRLPRQSDGTPKPTKRYFIIVEKHNICETVTGSIKKANLANLEALYKIISK